KALRLSTRRKCHVRKAKHSARRRPREEAQLMQYIAFDAHKHYTLASVARPDGGVIREERIEHKRGALEAFLARCKRGSPVALETLATGIGSWTRSRRQAACPNSLPLAPRWPAYGAGSSLDAATATTSRPLARLGPGRAAASDGHHHRSNAGRRGEERREQSGERAGRGSRVL